MAWDINRIPGGNVVPGYGTGSSASLGLQASLGPVGQDATTEAGTSQAVAQTVQFGGEDNVLVGAALFTGLLIALMLVAQRVGGEGGKFGNIRASFYNALVIGLAAIVTIPAIKYLFARFKVPHVSAWVLSV